MNRKASSDSFHAGRLQSFQTHFILDKTDLDEWMECYNNERTPLDTLLEGPLIWAEKNLVQI